MGVPWNTGLQAEVSMGRAIRAALESLRGILVVAEAVVYKRRWGCTQEAETTGPTSESDESDELWW